MIKVPSKVTIHRKTGASTTEYVEFADDEYDRQIVKSKIRLLGGKIIEIAIGTFKMRWLNVWY